MTTFHRLLLFGIGTLIRAIMGGPDKLAKRELRKKGHGLVRRILS